MITNDVMVVVEELLPFHARELEVAFDVTWAPVPVGTPTGQALLPLVQFLFVCKSPLLGQPPFLDVEQLQLAQALDVETIGRMLFAVCEAFRTRRAEVLGAVG